MTQRQLARAARISLGTLRDFEQGRTRSLRPAVLAKLAAVPGFEPAQRPDRAPANAERIRIAVLGPLTAWRDNAQLALGSARQRGVLGLLALHWGTSLHREAIIDALWGKSPPASVVTEVQGYVSRLRKLSGREHGAESAGHFIATVGTSYQLTVDADQLDCAMFGQLLRRGWDAHAGENPVLACALYQRALDLWRSPILVDLDLLRQHPAVTALSCKRSEAVLLYAAAAELAGAHGQVLSHLRDLCASEPFNEHAHAHLMIALAATGQQAAALQIFTDTRRRLDRELGVRPSAKLAEAHTRVLRQQIGALSQLSRTGRCFTCSRPPARAG